MRPVSFQRSFVKHPAGSCLVAFGETRVLCTASIENEVPPHRRGSRGGWVTAEYSMLPGSTSPRKRRDGLKQDGRSVEIQRLVGRSLRAAVDMDALGEVTIAIDCDVIQADGGTRTAAITGGWVALHDALTALAKRQNKPSIDAYLRGQIAAVSVGVVAGRIVCDLDYAADSKADVDMNVVMMARPGADARFIEVQGTGEHDSFARGDLDKMLDAAGEGIAELFKAQRAALAG
ncbi:MAG TPA: ribonuclease PH [Planctomycetota bacterium]|nr:ribonuclease PH [Planctomycetota bacterium]